MAILHEVPCANCQKIIYKKISRLNENQKRAWNFYCSRKCEGAHKQRRGQLICGNPICSKLFIKFKRMMSVNNYCLASCAAIVNNQRFPRKNIRRHYCAYAPCGKEFKGENKYCSKICAARGRGVYDQSYIINAITAKVDVLQRVPAKREIGDGIIQAAIRLFGSWSNAVRAAGYIPHRSDSEHMYRRVCAMAQDGHRCDSISEAVIDDWLHTEGIAHVRNAAYPDKRHLADWAINDGRTFVEYFGLAGDSPRYDRAITLKKELCRAYGITLIGIYSRDLYPRIR